MFDSLTVSDKGVQKAAYRRHCCISNVFSSRSFPYTGKFSHITALLQITWDTHIAGKMDSCTVLSSTATAISFLMWTVKILFRNMLGNRDGTDVKE